MIKTISINIRPNDNNSFLLIREIIGILDKKGITVNLPDYEIVHEEKLSRYICDEDEYIKTADLVIVIGGDGTFLRTARMFAETNTPIMGINRGRLGFLTEFSPDEVTCCLDDILDGNFRLAERAMLQVSHYRKKKVLEKAIFLNDAVISKGAFSRPIMIELEIDDTFLNSYSGDGLIIATCTGSTAYSLSAGGPIITPSVQDVFIINPICPHALSIRPMIFSTDRSLRARILSNFDNLLLTIDGQVAIKIEENDEIVVSGSDKKVKLITHPERNYYDILRQKLGWGKI